MRQLLIARLHISHHNALDVYIDLQTRLKSRTLSFADISVGIKMIHDHNDKIIAISRLSDDERERVFVI